MRFKAVAFSEVFQKRIYMSVEVYNLLIINVILCKDTIIL